MGCGHLALTARWTAAARARESKRADRLFEDPFAAALAGSEGRALLRDMEQVTGTFRENPYLALRTHFVDRVASAHIANGRPAQVVLLAAGLDTRAYRLQWPAGTVLYELDQSAAPAHKHEYLTARGAQTNCTVRTAQAELDHSGDWPDRLHSLGFDASAPTLWLAEGLLVYLDHADVDDLIRRLTHASALGSRLATDTLNSSIYQQPWAQSQLNLLQARGTPWRSSIDDPEEHLTRYGWAARAELPGNDPRTAERWPFSLPKTPADPRLFMIDGKRHDPQG